MTDDQILHFVSIFYMAQVLAFFIYSLYLTCLSKDPSPVEDLGTLETSLFRICFLDWLP
jgi:hypothetical protein